MRWVLFTGITLLAAGCQQTQDLGGSSGQPCSEDSGPCSPDGDGGSGMGGSGNAGGGMGGSGGGMGGSGGGGVSIGLWSKSFGNAGGGIANATAVDSAGNVVVTGSFNGTIDLGGGPLTVYKIDDIFLAKFDSSGNHLWSKRFGHYDFQSARGMAVDSADNVVLTGSFYGEVDFGGGPLGNFGEFDKDIYVAKFDSSGNHLWSKKFGDAGTQGATAMGVDSAGNVVVLGEFYNTVDFGGGPLTSTGGSDIFVTKLDANGNHVWSKRLGDAGNQPIVNAMAVDSAGNVAITGYMQGTVDFGGGPLTSAGKLDIFVAEFDPNGNHVWSERFGDGSDQFAYAMAVDSAGNVAITGGTEGTVDFGGGPLTSAGGSDVFVAKFDPNGNHVWSKRFGGASAQSAKAIAINSAGNAVITGQFSSQIDFGGGPLTSAGSLDIFVAKLDPSGNHLGSTRFGDENYQTAQTTAIDSAGNVVVTGNFGGTDAFLVKVKP